MKKWLSLMAAFLMCGMIAVGIHAVDPAEELTCEMVGETMMRPLAAGSAADLETVDGMDLDAFRTYLAAEMDKRNTQINIASYGIPYSQEYVEAIFDFIHVEMPEYFHANVTSLSYYTGGDIVYINVEYT
ncbi:MAG: hypothetical protein IKY52_02750, partial [Clostridia bacterium]|nr:hypothetical protein [Clostridia bacterium]